MKILITGFSGFIGSNLVEKLEELYGESVTLYKFNSKTPIETLDEYAKDCDFVYHLSAIHRPKTESEFNEINFELFSHLLGELEKNGNDCPVLYTSSIQAGNGSEYGKSKISAEERLIEHAEKMNSRAIIYRLTNTFGKWARPDGHSVVATFCYNIQHGLPVTVSNREHIMHFYYIDDVVQSFLERLNEVPPYNDNIVRDLDDNLTYTVSLGSLVDLLTYYKECDISGNRPTLSNAFEEKLYETFTSYKDYIKR